MDEQFIPRKGMVINMNPKGIHDNHRQRMRERYKKEGLTNFEPHEVLELLLYQSIPRVNTNPIGHRLMDKFGSLANVLTASEEALCGVKGVGKTSAKMICSVRQVLLDEMLADADFSMENDALEMAAEYHMRPRPDGSVTVLSREAVLDYQTDDGDWTGLCDAMVRTIGERGMTEYAVVIRCDDAVFPSATAEELGKGPFPWVWMLVGSKLIKITDLTAWEEDVASADKQTVKVVLRAEDA